MNVMSVIVPEAAYTKSVQKAKGQNEGQANDFFSFLQMGAQPNFQDNKVVNNANSLDNSNLANGVVSKFGENPELLQLISKLLSGELNHLEDIDEGLAHQLADFLKEIDFSEYNLAPEVIEHLESLFKVHLDTETNGIQYEMIQLMGELSQILNSNEEMSLKKQASELFPLLRQWTILKGQVEQAEAERLINNELSEKDATIWKQLVNVYEKRNFFTENNLYRSDSAVTQTDVMNWLQQAFSKYETQAEKVSAPVATHQQIPMTEVQQYTIHVNSLDKVERVSDEIMTKFQNIIRESRFMTNNNMNELSITLRPENLGNMIVRFTQVDGEMAVKIIVSSLAAKNMLEANIHQLKHMFSPHQVVIERNESISDEEFFHEENHDENEEETLDDERGSRENKEDNAPEIDFQELFQQVSEEEIAND